MPVPSGLQSFCWKKPITLWVSLSVFLSFFFFAVPVLLLIFVIVFNFCQLDYTCLGIFLLGFLPCEPLCTSWTCMNCYFPMLEKFSTIISSKNFSGFFSLSSPSGTPIMWMLVQKSFRLLSFLFILFPIPCSTAMKSTTLSSSSLICCSDSYNLLLILYSIFSFQLLCCLTLLVLYIF